MQSSHSSTIIKARERQLHDPLESLNATERNKISILESIKDLCYYTRIVAHHVLVYLRFCFHYNIRLRFVYDSLKIWQQDSYLTFPLSKLFFLLNKLATAWLEDENKISWGAVRLGFMFSLCIVKEIVCQSAKALNYIKIKARESVPPCRQ